MGRGLCAAIELLQLQRETFNYASITSIEHDSNESLISTWIGRRWLNQQIDIRRTHPESEINLESTVWHAHAHADAPCSMLYYRHVCICYETRVDYGFFPRLVCMAPRRQSQWFIRKRPTVDVFGQSEIPNTKYDARAIAMCNNNNEKTNIRHATSPPAQ